MKRFLALLLTAAAILSLSGCSTQKLTKDGITLILPKDFTEGDTYLLPDAHAVYSSSDTTVVVFKDEASAASELTVREYADGWILANLRFAPDPLKEDNGVISTKYKADNADILNVFYTAFYKNGGAFWIVQFFCPEESYEANAQNFEKWAKQVNFENK